MPASKAPKRDGKELQKKFQCSQCERTFTRAEHRARHELSHSDRRPYKCKECSSSFVRRDLLLRHSRTVHAPPEVKFAKAHSRSTSHQDSNSPYLRQASGLPSQDPNGAPQMNMYNGPPQQMYGAPMQWPQGSMTAVGAAAAAAAANISAPPNNPMNYFQGPAMGGQPKPSDPQRPPGSQEVTMAVFMSEMHHNASMLAKSQPPTPGSTSAMLSAPPPPPLPVMTPQAVPMNQIPQQMQHGPMTNGSGNGSTSTTGNGSNGDGHPHPRMASQPMDIPMSHQNGSDLGTTFAQSDVRQKRLPPLTSSEIKAISQIFTEGVKSSEEHGSSSIRGSSIDPSDKMQGSDSDFHYYNTHSPSQFAMPPIADVHAGVASLEEVDVIRIPKFESDADVSRLTEALRQHPSAFGTAHLIPTRQQLDRYLAVFFSFVHPLMPMLHPQTFECRQAPPALLYAICALGATTCHEKSMAQLLGYNCRLLVTMVPQQPPSGFDPGLLATTQAMIFLLHIATFSGDRGALDLANSVSIQIVQNIAALTQDVTRLHSTENETNQRLWAQREEIIRAHWMSFVTIGLLHAHCGLPVCYRPEQISPEMPLPSCEALWNATINRNEDWVFYFHVSLADNACQIRFGELLEQVKTGNKATFRRTLTPFCLRVLGALISFADIPKQHVYNGIALWAHTSRDATPGLGQGGLQVRRSLPYLRIIRSTDLFDRELYGTSRLMTAMEAEQHPLLLTCYAFFDSAFVSTIVDLSLWRSNLGHLDAQSIAQAAYDFASRPLSIEQLTLLLPVVLRTVDVVLSLVSLGPHLLAVIMASPMSLYMSHLCILDIEAILIAIVWFHRVGLVPQATIPAKFQQTMVKTEAAMINAGIQPINNSLGVGLADGAARCFEAVKPWQTCETLAVSLRIFISHMAT